MVKRERRYASHLAYLIFLHAGGGAAQVPYGNAPVIPAGLEGKTISGPFWHVPFNRDLQNLVVSLLP